MFLKIFYSFLIIYFILFAIFWADCKHKIIISLFTHTRKAIVYLGLWHSWAVFSRPWKQNRNLLLNVEYHDEKKEIINLFNSENAIFFNRKLSTFDQKFTEGLLLRTKTRANFVYYLKKHIENIENKKIKKIEFVEENKKINLWNSTGDSSDFVVLSSHKF